MDFDEGREWTVMAHDEMVILAKLGLGKNWCSSVAQSKRAVVLHSHKAAGADMAMPESILERILRLDYAHALSAAFEKVADMLPEHKEHVSAFALHIADSSMISKGTHH